MIHIVYLALGTNLGDRMKNLTQTIAALTPDVQVIDQSSVYETPPWGVLNQPKFLNQVVKAETHLEPLDLLTYLKDIERRMGRRKTYRYGPRVIDIDILFFDDWVLDLPGLSIPHPRLHERGFVLVPLCEIAPDLRHPVFDRKINELLEDVSVEGIENGSE